MSEAQRLDQNLAEFRSLDNIGRVQQGVGGTGSFPAIYDSQKGIIERKDLRDEYVDKVAGARTKIVDYSPSQQDLADIQLLKKERELIAFEEYLARQFNLRDINHQKIVRELYPEYFEKRWNLIKKKLDWQKRLAHINLFGMTNKEDLILSYALTRDPALINSLKTAVHLQFKEGEGRDAWARGIFNFKKFVGDKNDSFIQGIQPSDYSGTPVMSSMMRDNPNVNWRARDTTTAPTIT